VIELMYSFSRQPSNQQGLSRFTTPLTRKPSRVTITIPWSLRQTLDKQSDEEGRSLSNLIAYLLEQSIENRP
jgi:hypothetical protein